MALTSKISWNVAASYSGVRGRVSGSGALAEAGAIALTDGTAAGQADGLFSAAPDIAAGQVHTYSLSEGLLDLYGATLDFSAIKLILIEADSTNTADLIVGGGTWPGPFGDGSGGVTIKPGCAFMMACQDATGWPVDEETDELLIACAADGSYGLTLIGVSSAISPPAFASPPTISGTPIVGVPLSCNDGDWSGAPVFTYRWTRGGSPIAGATGATYTPVQADVGRKIARISLAMNVAGSSQGATPPMVCLARPTADATGVTADSTVFTTDLN